MRVYVAAPYEDAPRVRRLHERLRSLGFHPSSKWAEQAMGPEDFSQFVPDQLREIAESNDNDVVQSAAAIVLARPGAGGEMFAEARLAIDHGLSVFWVGRRTLSAYRVGVTRCQDVEEAIELLTKASVAI